ncbi:MAG: PH domain-containing protein [Solirubrobacteraceae bacterium]|nr:PH domain-containing protein [Patulibacter sp.]
MTSDPGDAAQARAAADDDIDERRLHPASLAIEAIHHARGFAFGFIAVIASQGLVRGALIVAALLLLASIHAVVNWRVTRYAVVDHTLRLRTGVFARKEQNVPASRISALDTSRGLLQRIFGVVAVQVQTAGGKQKAELVLRAVSLPEAERLRHALGHRSAPLSDPAGGRPAASLAGAAVPGDHAVPANDGAAPAATFVHPGAVADDAPVVFAMTPRELLMGALTSPSIAVVGAATAALYSVLSDAIPDRLKHQISGAVDDLSVTTALELAAFAIVVAVIVSVVGTVLLYANFQITRDERRLRIRRGLITEHVGTVPIDRIHGLRIVESPLRQLLGYASIEVEVAGYARQDEATRTLVPYVRRSEVPALIERLVPDITWPTAPLRPVPRRARRRYVTVPLLVSLIPVAGIVAAPIGVARAAAILFPGLAIAIGVWRARDAGWLLDGDVLVLRWRWFGRSTLLARAPRLQLVIARATPWQRRAALATLMVRLSNKRTGQVRHLDSADATGLLGVASR